MNDKKGLIIFVLLGLFLGVCLDIFHYFDIQYGALYCLVTLFCLLFGLSYNNTHNTRLIITSALVAGLLSLPIIPIHANNLFPNVEQLLSFLLAFPILIYIVHSFHYGYHRDNHLNMSYSRLFEAVWNTLPLLIVASIFSVIANFLIIMAAYLFKSVGSEFLWSFYFNNININTLTHTTLFFIGLYIGQQNIHVINNIRFLMLRMMHYLLPLLAVISVLYFFLYISHPLDNNNALSPISILLSLIALGIIFINAHFQDGLEQTHYPNGIVALLKFYRLILPCLCIVMIYRIYQTMHYPLNISLYLTITLLYCLSYAIAVFLSPHYERLFIIRSNKNIALMFTLLLLIFNNPFHPINITLGKATLESVPFIQTPGLVIPPIN